MLNYCYSAPVVVIDATRKLFNKDLYFIYK